MTDPTPAAETADNKARTRRWFEEVWNQGRAATIDELLAPHAVAHGLGDAGPGADGLATFRAFYATFRAALSDLRVDVDDVLGDGDRTAARITLRATHTGPGLGAPPTGARVTATGICVMRWADGQSVEGWNEYDAAGLMRQIAAAASAARQGGGV